jgi:hypothetical protein
MSGIARATLSSGKKSSSVLQLARTGGAGPQTDPVEKGVTIGICSSDWKPRTGNFATRPSSLRSRFKSCATVAGPRKGPLAIARPNMHSRPSPAKQGPPHRVGGRTDCPDAQGAN